MWYTGKNNVCKYITPSLIDLNKHVLHEHGTECPECDYASMDMHEVESHMLTQHEMDLILTCKLMWIQTLWEGSSSR